MAHSDKHWGLTPKARRDRLEAIIRERLRLDEDWFGITSRPSFFDKMDKSRLSAFENALGQVVRLGCKWEVMLACLACYDTYNAKQRVVRPAQYENQSEKEEEAVYELSRLPVKVWDLAAARPPNSDRRKSIDASLSAAAGEIESHENLLSTLGQFDPPPPIAWSDPSTYADMRNVRITANDALLNVQRLLGWCRRLLSDDSIGNFKTVESVAQLIPCVYVEVAAAAAKSGKMRRLLLTPVGVLLDAMSGRSEHRQDQLRVALTRFERDYPKIHRELRDKIRELHLASNEPVDGWRQLFAAEDRRRSR